MTTLVEYRAIGSDGSLPARYLAVGGSLELPRFEEPVAGDFRWERVVGGVVTHIAERKGSIWHFYWF